MSLRPSKSEHEVFYQDLVKLLDKHAGKLTAIEMLAVAANLVGKLMAMQDQRKVTPALAVETVARNIEQGNQQAIEKLTRGQAGSA